MNNNSVYIDTETTGLDSRIHDTIEAAWAVNDTPTRRIVFPHHLEHADMNALNMNGYRERGLDHHTIHHTEPQTRTALHREFVDDLWGSTIIAENYGFDLRMLLAKLGFEPWHYRPIELSSVAMIVFDLDRPEGIRHTATRLRDLGFQIPANDHTAVGDVECLRACYNALRRLRREAMPAADQLLEAQEVAF